RERSSLKRQYSEHVPERESARVAHKDRRGIDIEDQKSPQRSGDGEARRGYRGHSSHGADHRNRSGDRKSDARRQTVKSVDEVERVGRGDQPEDADPYTQKLPRNERVTGQREHSRPRNYRELA